MRTPPEGNWHYELITEGLMQLEQIREVLFEGDSPYQHVLIHDAECFGRSLVLDDKTQSTELDEFVYHEALVQPAMIAHPNPRTVFIAGGGEGATAREALRHRSVERVVMVDLDELVVQHVPQVPAEPPPGRVRRPAPDSAARRRPASTSRPPRSAST